VGYAISAAGTGFQDQIALIFGYEPKSKRLLALKILESKETPGLGERIETDTSYTSQFGRSKAPLVPVKRGDAKPGDSTNVQTITGATISSKAVIRIINAAIARWTPLIASAPAAAAPAAAPAGGGSHD
jgi:electron transport complex protein RnfG